VLTRWNRSEDVKLVLLRGEGGNFKWLKVVYDRQLLIDKFKKPVVAFAERVTMGGGLGDVLGADVSVVTEDFMGAMKENFVGFPPDVLAIPRFVKRMGLPLARYYLLTGATMSGHEAVKFGLADVMVKKERLGKVQEKLEELARESEVVTVDDVKKVINQFRWKPQDKKADTLDTKLRLVERFFNTSDVDEIERALRVASKRAGPERDFAVKALKALDRASPLSLRVTAELIEVADRLIRADVPDLLVKLSENEQAVAHAMHRVKDVRSGIRAFVAGNKKPKFPSKDFSAEKLKRKVAAILKTVVHTGLEGLELYQKTFSKMRRMRILEEDDVAAAGKLLGFEILRNIQIKQMKNPRQHVGLHTSTGKTPWIGYTVMAETLEKDWENPETRDYLRANGINPDFKPDMKRVKVFAMDTLFPQWRNDHHALANDLRVLLDRWGVPEKNRSIFYGDVKNAQGQQLSKKDYRELIKSVDKHGLLLEDYRKDSEALAKTHSKQHAFFKAMDGYAKAYAEEVRKFGGVHIFIAGLGPSYAGEGHLAFLLSGMSFEQGVFMQMVVYHIAAEYMKEAGGMGNLTTVEGRIKLGFATLGYTELFFRENVMVIAIATDQPKAESVRQAIEKPSSIRRPWSYFQKKQGLVILDRAAASRLRYKTHPWDFQRIEDWTDGQVASLFMKLSEETGKRIQQITKEDFLSAKGKKYPDIMTHRKANLDRLRKKGHWNDLKTKVVKRIQKNLMRAKGVHKRLGLKSGQEEKIFNPHMDDEFLALFWTIIADVKAGLKVSAHYMTPGYTVVDDNYTLNVLSAMAEFGDKEIKALAGEAKRSFKKTEKKYLGQLINVIRDQNLHESADDYDIWSHMSGEEKALRTKLLFLRLNRQLGRKLTSQKTAQKMYKVLKQIIRAKPRGGQDIELVKAIKTFLRFSEAQSALMSLGVQYENIHEPLKASYYGPARTATANTKDIANVVRIIGRDRPDVVVVNNEGFTVGPHAATQATVMTALRRLADRGKLSPKVLFYLGVWARLETSALASQISLMLTQQELDDYDRLFRQFYPSQSPPLNPDSGRHSSAHFSAQVVHHAKATKKEIEGYIGPLGNDVAGVLNFNYFKDLNDEVAHQDMDGYASELERVRGLAKRAASDPWKGPKPLPNLKKHKNLAKLLRTGPLTLTDILTRKEIRTTGIPSRRAASELRQAVIVRRRTDPTSGGRALKGAQQSSFEIASTLPGTLSRKDRRRAELRQVEVSLKQYIALLSQLKVNSEVAGKLIEIPDLIDEAQRKKLEVWHQHNQSLVETMKTYITNETDASAAWVSGHADPIEQSVVIEELVADAEEHLVQTGFLLDASKEEPIEVNESTWLHPGVLRRMALFVTAAAKAYKEKKYAEEAPAWLQKLLTSSQKLWNEKDESFTDIASLLSHYFDMRDAIHQQLTQAASDDPAQSALQDNLRTVYKNLNLIYVVKTETEPADIELSFRAKGKSPTRIAFLSRGDSETLHLDILSDAKVEVGWEDERNRKGVIQPRPGPDGKIYTEVIIPKGQRLVLTDSDAHGTLFLWNHASESAEELWLESSGKLRVSKGEINLNEIDLATEYFKSDRFLEAAQQALKMIKQNPHSNKSWRILFMSLLHEKKYEEIANYRENALKHHGKSIFILNTLRRAYAHLGLYDDAQSIQSRISELSSTEPKTEMADDAQYNRETDQIIRTNKQINEYFSKVPVELFQPSTSEWVPAEIQVYRHDRDFSDMRDFPISDIRNPISEQDGVLLVLRTPEGVEGTLSFDLLEDDGAEDLERHSAGVVNNGLVLRGMHVRERSRLTTPFESRVYRDVERMLLAALAYMSLGFSALGEQNRGTFIIYSDRLVHPNNPDPLSTDWFVMLPADTNNFLREMFSEDEVEIEGLEDLSYSYQTILNHLYQTIGMRRQSSSLPEWAARVAGALIPHLTQSVRLTNRMVVNIKTGKVDLEIVEESDRGRVLVTEEKKLPAEWLNPLREQIGDLPIKSIRILPHPAWPLGAVSPDAVNELKGDLAYVLDRVADEILSGNLSASVLQDVLRTRRPHNIFIEDRLSVNIVTQPEGGLSINILMFPNISMRHLISNIPHNLTDIGKRVISQLIVPSGIPAPDAVRIDFSQRRVESEVAYAVSGLDRNRTMHRNRRRITFPEKGKNSSVIPFQAGSLSNVDITGVSYIDVRRFNQWRGKTLSEDQVDRLSSDLASFIGDLLRRLKKQNASGPFLDRGEVQRNFFYRGLFSAMVKRSRVDSTLSVTIDVYHPSAPPRSELREATAEDLAFAQGVQKLDHTNVSEVYAKVGRAVQRAELRSKLTRDDVKQAIEAIIRNRVTAGQRGPYRILREQLTEELRAEKLRADGVNVFMSTVNAFLNKSGNKDLKEKLQGMLPLRPNLTDEALAPYHLVIEKTIRFKVERVLKNARTYAVFRKGNIYRLILTDAALQSLGQVLTDDVPYRQFFIIKAIGIDLFLPVKVDDLQWPLLDIHAFSGLPQSRRNRIGFDHEIRVGEETFFLTELQTSRKGFLAYQIVEGEEAVDFFVLRGNSNVDWRSVTVVFPSNDYLAYLGLELSPFYYAHSATFGQESHETRERLENLFSPLKDDMEDQRVLKALDYRIGQKGSESALSSDLAALYGQVANRISSLTQRIREVLGKVELLNETLERYLPYLEHAEKFVKGIEMLLDEISKEVDVNEVLLIMRKMVFNQYLRNRQHVFDIQEDLSLEIPKIQAAQSDVAFLFMTLLSLFQYGPIERTVHVKTWQEPADEGSIIGIQVSSPDKIYPLHYQELNLGVEQVRSITEVMGGQLEVIERSGEIHGFIVRLPAARAELRGLSGDGDRKLKVRGRISASNPQSAIRNSELKRSEARSTETPESVVSIGLKFNNPDLDALVDELTQRIRDKAKPSEIPNLVESIHAFAKELGTNDRTQLQKKLETWFTGNNYKYFDANDHPKASSLAQKPAGIWDEEEIILARQIMLRTFVNKRLLNEPASIGSSGSSRRPASAKSELRSAGRRKLPRPVQRAFLALTGLLIAAPAVQAIEEAALEVRQAIQQQSAQVQAQIIAETFTLDTVAEFDRSVGNAYTWNLLNGREPIMPVIGPVIQATPGPDVIIAPTKVDRLMATQATEGLAEDEYAIVSSNEEARAELKRLGAQKTRLYAGKDDRELEFVFLRSFDEVVYVKSVFTFVRTMLGEAAERIMQKVRAAYEFAIKA